MSVTNDYGLAEVCSPQTPTLHVVLVHGLNGGRSTTWTNKDGVFWPAWISSLVPGAKVWVYGYNARVFTNGSLDHIVLQATKILNAMVEKGVGRRSNQGNVHNDGGLVPVVLLGHSLGGILIKQAILLTSAERTLEYSYLFDAVVAVCFCATPHRGSRWANRLFALYLGQSTAFIGLLRSGTQSSLSTIADQFNNVWGRKPVWTFVETVGIPPLGIIVQILDARTNCSSERVYRVNKDHRTIVKPDEREDYMLGILVNSLKDITRTGPPTISHREQHSVDLVQPLPNNGFSFEQPSRRNLYFQFCAPRPESYVWENRLYRNGAVEVGLDDHSAGITAETFEGGVFYYNWPPDTTTCVSMEVDMRSNEFAWTITSPDSLCYPGRHAGVIRLGADFYPFGGRSYLSVPVPKWTTPLLCPFVSERGNISPADGTWQATWSPVFRLDHITCTFAAIIHYGPLFQGITPAVAARNMGLHPFSERDERYLTPEPWFRNATNFFCRVYNSNCSSLDGDENMEFLQGAATDDMRQQSILAIRELVLHTLDGELAEHIVSGASLTGERAGLGLEGCFSVDKIKTRQDWILEELFWADLLSPRFGVKKQ